MGELQFAPLQEYRDDYLRALGYAPVRVSVFDHWLSPDEASDSRIINYRAAVANNCLQLYLSGEESFFGFYHDLVEGSDSYEICHDGSAVQFKNLAELDDVILKSLREQSLMDIFFSVPAVRVVGGYDRTDLLLLRGDVTPDWVAIIARSHGLYILPGGSA